MRPNLGLELPTRPPESIVPVAIHGAHEIWPRGAGLRWASFLPFSGARARLEYGPAVLSGTPATAEAGSADAYSGLTAALRDAVVGLWDGLDRDSRG